MSSEPIKVLEVCQRMEAAGVQSFLMNMYRNMDREKVQMDFLVHYKEDQFFDDEIMKLGGKVYKLSVREDYNLFKYFYELYKFYKTHPEYKIVHGHMDTLGFFYLGIAKICGVPVRIAHSHNSFIQTGIKRPFRMLMIKLYSKPANKLAACSKNAGEFMFGNSKFEVINNAIDTKKYKFNNELRLKKRKEIGFSDNDIVVGNVGRFHKSKNQIFLIDVLNELKKINKSYKLLLVGSGEKESEIKKKIKEFNLESDVTILSNRRDVDELYQAMDGFIMPSFYEGLPVTGIEAQASGLPCFFSDTVTKAVNITNNSYFMSLKSNEKKWAQDINERIENFERKDVSELVKRNGYDAMIEAKKLEQRYLDLFKEE